MDMQIAREVAARVWCDPEMSSIPMDVGLAEKIAENVFLAAQQVTEADQGGLLEAAWGIIANAGGGNWATQTREWQDAAARWRDKYHSTAAPVA